MNRRSLHTNKRKGARGRREGAVFVEALIVIGLILVAMQCVWWMYQFCLFQHRAKVEARAKAWENSLKGCTDPELGGALGSLSKSATGSDVGGLKSDSEDAPGWMQIGKGDPSEVTLDLPEEIFGATSVGSKAQFACNEKGGKKEMEFGGGGPDADATIAEATATP